MTLIVVEDFEDEVLDLVISGDWARDSTTAASGSWSLRSAPITHGGTSDAVVQVPAGATRVTFRLRVSSEGGFDYFRLLVGDVEVGRDSGEIPWVKAKNFDLNSASTVTLRYTKDSSDTVGLDAAWVDLIEFSDPIRVSGADSGALAETASVLVLNEVGGADAGTLTEAAHVDQPLEVGVSGSDTGVLTEAHSVSDAPTILATVRSTSTVASADTNFTCDAPAGLAARDRVFALQVADRGALTDLGTPTGGATWQLADSYEDPGASFAAALWQKQAEGSEPSTYGFAQHNDADGVVIMVAVEGAAPTAPIIAQVSVGSDNLITTPGITPSSQYDLEIRLAAGYANGTVIAFTPPAGYAELADVQSRTYSAATAAMKRLTTSAPTAPLDFVAGVDPLIRRVGFTVAVAPAYIAPLPDHKVGSDTASLTQTATVGGSTTDSALLTEAAQLSLTSSDTAVLAESSTFNRPAAAVDAAVLSDIAVVGVVHDRVDTAALDNTAVLSVIQDRADSAAFAESVALGVAAADDAAVSETSSLEEILGPATSDQGALGEVAAIAAAAAASDGALLDDHAAGAVLRAGGDTAALAEASAVELLATDTAVTGEAANVVAALRGTDAAVLTETAHTQQPMATADAAGLVESATVTDLGRDIRGAGPPYTRWAASSPSTGWAAGPPTTDWAASGPYQ